MAETKIEKQVINIGTTSYIKKDGELKIGVTDKKPIELTNGDTTIALVNKLGETELKTLYIKGPNDTKVDVGKALEDFESVKDTLKTFVYYFVSVGVVKKYPKPGGSKTEFLESVKFEKTDINVLLSGKYKINVKNCSNKIPIEVSFCGNHYELKSQDGTGTGTGSEIEDKVTLEKAEQVTLQIIHMEHNLESHDATSATAMATLTYLG